MLEHFCECYSDLSGPILFPVLGSITPLFIPNSRIRPIRLIGLCASLITFLYSPAPRLQFDPSTAKSADFGGPSKASQFTPSLH
uniref:NADH-ubiquinone oxidoreductase chain 4 n=1 Tax=Populus trichocarpa TaxID=3694 RepID=A0A2K2AKE1_POPTR